MVGMHMLRTPLHCNPYQHKPSAKVATVFRGELRWWLPHAEAWQSLRKTPTGVLRFAVLLKLPLGRHAWYTQSGWHDAEVSNEIYPCSRICDMYAP